MTNIEIWGTGSWGVDQYWGDPKYDVITSGRNLRLAVDSWPRPSTSERNSNNRALLRALVTSLDSIDESLEQIYNEHHINSSTGSELDRIGQFVGVTRQSNESDSRYRTRIKARFRAGTIEPTTDNFSEFVATLLETSINNFSLTLPQGQPVINVSAQSSIWEDNDLTASTLVDLLNNAVPAGHNVNIQEEGTFQLKQDGDTDDPSTGLTSDSISTGGTLSSDVV